MFALAAIAAANLGAPARTLCVVPGRVAPSHPHYWTEGSSLSLVLCAGNGTAVGVPEGLSLLELTPLLNESAGHAAAGWAAREARGAAVLAEIGRSAVVRAPAGAAFGVGVRATPVLPFRAAAGREDPRLRAVAAKVADAGSDPVVAGLLTRFTAELATSYLDHLTGVTSNLRSRNAIHPDGKVAAEWIAAEFTKYGFSTELESFGAEGQWTTPNVIATLRGNAEPDTIVVVGAHYDSRGRDRSSATAPAPGANDDGSGTSFLLQLARAVHEADVSFKYTLVIGAWGAEEQGLVGSRAYAKKMKDAGADILAMLQADMIAFRVPTESIQQGFPDRFASQLLTDLSMSLFTTYAPEVETCYSPVCCSDHQSFTEQGYAATQFFERCGGIADDRYHDAGDVVDRRGFDIEGQLLSLSRGVAAVAFTVLEVIG